MSTQQTVVIEQRSNGVGTAGFVVSLIGFLTCGLLCPLGLLLSLFGLLFRPRGLAVAGFLLGLIGSLWLWLAGFALVAGFLGVGAAVNEAAKQSQRTTQTPVVEIERPTTEATTVEPQTPQQSAPIETQRELRTWTDATGKFSIEARLVSVLKGKAKLAKTDGAEIDVEIDKLSDADQRHIRQLMRE